MHSPFFDQINAVFPLKERDIGEFRSFRIMGMSFQASAWEAKGLGAVSFTSGSAPLGLMSIGSLIIRMVSEGGVSTNLFLKAWGKEKGGRFVREVAFGVR